LNFTYTPRGQVDRGAYIPEREKRISPNIKTEGKAAAKCTCQANTNEKEK
jgi:hypothetical protein